MRATAAEERDERYKGIAGEAVNKVSIAVLYRAKAKSDYIEAKCFSVER